MSVTKLERESALFVLYQFLVGGKGVIFVMAWGHEQATHAHTTFHLFDDCRTTIEEWTFEDMQSRTLLLVVCGARFVIANNFRDSRNHSWSFQSGTPEALN